MDGFNNFAARLGLDQDNLLARSGYAPGRYITRSRTELDDMYRSSWVVGRAVEVVAEDMVRSGIEIQGSLPPEDVTLLLKEYRATGIPGRLSDAIKWGRLYGGALAVMLIDGQDTATPLEMDTVQRGSFRGLYVLDRHEINPSTETIAELGPMFGYPEYYQVNKPDAGERIRVHSSRALRFVGVTLPAEMRRTEQGWGASVVERVFDRILALDSATYGASNLLLRSFLRVIKIDKYREILAAGGRTEQALHKMFAFIRQMQSNEGITLLDKNDDFQVSGWTFAGVYDALQAFSEQISGATGIPLIRLLGQSPKGFSTGESDMRTYYDTIATQLDDDKRPADAMLFGVLSRHLWGKPLPDDFSFEYQSLFVPSEMEKSQIAASDAQAVAGLFGAGIINPAQALSELKDAGRLTGRYTSITEADIEAAKEAASAPPPAEGGMEGFLPQTPPV
jgi:phage-related protein (TIGR01555 family)